MQLIPGILQMVVSQRMNHLYEKNTDVNLWIYTVSGREVIILVHT